VRLHLALALTLFVAACADQGSTASLSNSSAPAVVDLGGSSRVPHVAGAAGEGEGYGAAQQPSRQEPTATVTAGAGTRTPRPSVPTANQGPIDHGKMDHSRMDHSQVDHGGGSPIPGGQQ
jgi:hypothetical protein